MASVRVLGSSWIVRSLSVNAGGSLLDWLTVWALVQGLEASTSSSTLAGLLMGCTFSFILNKRFAFKAQGPAGPQVLKYAMGMAVLMALHSSLVGLLVDRFGIPLIAAKLCADSGIMATGQLVLLRQVVFKQVAAAAAPALATAPARS
ncbi:MAG: GtrA family protein [Myxococcaceae bacterium]